MIWCNFALLWYTEYAKEVGAMKQFPSDQPFFVDDEGEPHYLTGEISVRFRAVPGDEDLHRFAAEHSLRLLRRNEFVPQQVVFKPLDASRSYLPDLVESIKREGLAKAVWANTLSRYQRVA